MNKKIYYYFMNKKIIKNKTKTKTNKNKNRNRTLTGGMGNIVYGVCKVSETGTWKSEINGKTGTWKKRKCSKGRTLFSANIDGMYFSKIPNKEQEQRKRNTKSKSNNMKLVKQIFNKSSKATIKSMELCNKIKPVKRGSGSNKSYLDCPKYCRDSINNGYFYKQNFNKHYCGVPVSTRGKEILPIDLNFTLRNYKK